MFGGLSVQTLVLRRSCVPFRDLSSATSSRELFVLSAHERAAREKLVKISNVAFIVFVSFFDCFARLNGHFASLKIDCCLSRAEALEYRFQSSYVQELEVVLSPDVDV